MKVLVADDDPLSRRLLERTLQRWQHEVIAVADGEQAWRALQEEGAPRLAILDWMMPGLDGPGLCRRIRREAPAPYVYCLLLTARDHKGDLVAGLEAGADDFLVKPFDASELRARLRSAGRVLDLEGALRLQVTHDPLTGALNRTAILDLLDREWHRGTREVRPLAIMMADLDAFKAVNDTYGHVCGDTVLREVVRTMRGSVRAYDGVGRYGGEEFLIVLPGCDGRSASALAERVRSSVAAQPVQLADVFLPVTLSIGVAARDLADVEDPEAMIRAADAALYSAKRGGRNRVELATMVLRR